MHLEKHYGIKRLKKCCIDRLNRQDKPGKLDYFPFAGHATEIRDHPRRKCYRLITTVAVAAEKRKVVRMDQHALVAVGPSYRNAGMAAIASGVIGITACGLILDAVMTRVSWIPSDRIWMLFDTFDIAVGVQFLLLIPAVFGLRTLSRQSPPGLSRATFATGVGAIIFVVLLVLLGVGDKIVSNGLYTIPQGIFGIWLIVVNWRLSRSLPRWLRWFGMIVGLGLALVGTCFVGLCFVYPSQLYIPHPPQESIKEVNSVANTFWHHLLYFASFMGVATLPIWTILTGFQLLKKRHA